MSHTYPKIWLHFIWSPKDRQPVLRPEIQEPVYQHIIETARDKGIHVDEVNGMSDHVHCLVLIQPKHSASDVANAIKGESSHWINSNRLTPMHFAWQDGFAVYSVSESLVERVREYIRNQKEHHRQMSFAEEVEKLFALHRIEEQ